MIAAGTQLASTATGSPRLRTSGADALAAYRRNVRLKLFKEASQVIMEDSQ